MEDFLEQIQKLLNEIDLLKKEKELLIAKIDNIGKELNVYKELIRNRSNLPSLDVIKSEGLEKLISDFEKGIILTCMNASNGNQTEAANLCMTTKRIMQYKCTKFNIR